MKLICKVGKLRNKFSLFLPNLLWIWSIEFDTYIYLWIYSETVYYPHDRQMSGNMHNLSHDMNHIWSLNFSGCVSGVNDVCSELNDEIFYYKLRSQNCYHLGLFHVLGLRSYHSSACLTQSCLVSGRGQLLARWPFLLQHTSYAQLNHSSGRLVVRSRSLSIHHRRSTEAMDNSNGQACSVPSLPHHFNPAAGIVLMTGQLLSLGQD
jgi:hypothetical protein